MIHPIKIKHIGASLLCIALSTFSLQGHSQILLDSVAAVVNNAPVLNSEVDARIAMVVRDSRKDGQQLPNPEELRKRVLEQLIVEQVQIQAGERRGIRVTTQQLESALNNVAKNNNLSLIEFRNAVIAQGQDFDKIRDQIERQVLLSQIQSTLVNQRIRISEREIQSYLNSEAANNNSSLEMNLSSLLVAIPAQASAADIRSAQENATSYYQQAKAGADFSQLASRFSDAQNALKGGALGWRVIQQMPEILSQSIQDLDKGSISPPIKTPNGFYIFKVNDKRGESKVLVNQTQVRHILVSENAIRNGEQSRALIGEIKRRLANGESFEKLAQTYSDDPGSAADGGSLGWTQQGQMVQSFQDTMNNTAIGAVSAPFQSQFGWHILQVQDRRQQDLSEEKRLSDANNILRQRRYSEELNYWIRELRTAAYIDIKS